MVTKILLPLAAGLLLSSSLTLQNIQVNTSAPAFFTKTIFIKASPEVVWKKITDIDRWNTWLPDMKEAKLQGPLQEGTVFVQHPGGTKIKSTIHTAIPNTFFGWTGVVYGIKGIHNFRITEVAGGTEVEESESFDGFLASVFKKACLNMLTKGITETLNALKDNCEK